MKKLALTLISSALLVLAGCDGTNDSLSNGSGGESVATNTDQAGGGGPNGENHSQDPNGADPTAAFAAPDPAQKRVDDATAGDPATIARLHSCGKVTVQSLQSILATRGINMAGGAASAGGSRALPSIACGVSWAARPVRTTTSQSEPQDALQ